MLLISCPYCGERPEIEFAHAGEAHIARPEDPSMVSDDDWETFLYMRSNKKGVVAERWRHVHGCQRYFNAIRHSVTDKFIATYKTGDQPPNIDVLDTSGTGK